MFHDYHLHGHQKNSTIYKQAENDNAFEVETYIANGNLTMRPQNVSMFYNVTVNKNTLRLYDGPQLDLKNISSKGNQSFVSYETWNG